MLKEEDEGAKTRWTLRSIIVLHLTTENNASDRAQGMERFTDETANPR
jgi:hypothetical protein